MAINGSQRRVGKFYLFALLHDKLQLTSQDIIILSTVQRAYRGENLTGICFKGSYLSDYSRMLAYRRREFQSGKEIWTSRKHSANI